MNKALFSKLPRSIFRTINKHHLSSCCSGDTLIWGLLKASGNWKKIPEARGPGKKREYKIKSFFIFTVKNYWLSFLGFHLWDLSDVVTREVWIQKFGSGGIRDFIYILISIYVYLSIFLYLWNILDFWGYIWKWGSRCNPNTWLRIQRFDCGNCDSVDANQ